MRHRYRRAATRPAGHEVGVQGIARGRMGRAKADEASGELVEIGLADQDRTRGQQARDARGGLGRHEGEVRTGRCSGQAGDVEIILDREGHAPERFFGRVEGPERRRGCESLCLGQQGEEDTRIIDGGESPVGLGQDFSRAEAAGVGRVQGGDCREGRHGSVLVVKCHRPARRAPSRAIGPSGAIRASSTRKWSAPGTTCRSPARPSALRAAW